jgi:hypothetical protein
VPDLFTGHSTGDILPADSWNDNWDLVENSFGLVGPYVVTGLVPSAGAGLSVNVTAGTALIDGYVSFGSFSISGLTDNTTNHVYANLAGSGTANTTGTQPAGTVKLGTAVTAAGAVTSVDTAPGSGRQIKPTASTVVNRAIQTKTSAYTLTANDSVILADASGGAFTLTLPTAVGISGTVYTIKRISASNNVTIDGAGAETIDGAATYVLTAQWQAVELISNGTSWFVIGEWD